MFIDNFDIFVTIKKQTNMRKLNFLKAIVDYIWILSIIFYPIIIIASIMLIIDQDIVDIPLKISGNTISLKTIWGKIALLVSVTNFGLALIALFNFKKLLSNFKRRLIFEIETYSLLRKIGQLIIYSSILYLISETFSRLSSDSVSIEFGFGPFMYLLSLGLFFIVLSEVFKIGKKIKEENELTI